MASVPRSPPPCGAGVLGVLDAGDVTGLVVGVAGGVPGAAGVGLQVGDSADQPAGGLVVGVFLDQLGRRRRRLGCPSPARSRRSRWRPGSSCCWCRTRSACPACCTGSPHSQRAGRHRCRRHWIRLVSGLGNLPALGVSQEPAIGLRLSRGAPGRVRECLPKGRVRSHVGVR